ncbi:MAG: type IV pilus assembly protein PilM [Gammaproteobacteria bacterium]|nr:type IV pilus assembly protein PilM [Gammaproteobacteria bacterium]
MRLFTRKVPKSASAPPDAPPVPLSGFAERNPATAKHRRRWLGLDIGSSAVKVVELSRQGEAYRVEAFAVEPVPPGSVVAGNISDAGAVGEAIRKACERAGTKPRNVCAGIRDSAVVTKTLEMDASLSDRELEAEVTLEAERQMPFPVDEMAIDFEPMHLSSRDPSRVDVLLVACRLEHVVLRQEAAELGGVHLDIVDVESHAVQRAVAEVAPERQPVAFADIGASTSTLMIVDGESVVAREEQFAIDRLATDALGTDAHATEPLLGLLTRLLRLVRLGNPTTPLDRLLLAGGIATTPGLAERIGEHLKLAVEIADACRDMAVAEHADAVSLGEHAPMLFTACGLALRGFDEVRT